MGKIPVLHNQISPRYMWNHLLPFCCYYILLKSSLRPQSPLKLLSSNKVEQSQQRSAIVTVIVIIAIAGNEGSLLSSPMLTPCGEPVDRRQETIQSGIKWSGRNHDKLSVLHFPFFFFPFFSLRIHVSKEDDEMWRHMFDKRAPI